MTDDEIVHKLKTQLEELKKTIYVAEKMDISVEIEKDYMGNFGITIMKNLTPRAISD